MFFFVKRDVFALSCLCHNHNKVNNHHYHHKSNGLDTTFNNLLMFDVLGKNMLALMFEIMVLNVCWTHFLTPQNHGSCCHC